MKLFRYCLPFTCPGKSVLDDWFSGLEEWKPSGKSACPSHYGNTKLRKQIKRKNRKK